MVEDQSNVPDLQFEYKGGLEALVMRTAEAVAFSRICGLGLDRVCLAGGGIERRVVW